MKENKKSRNQLRYRYKLFIKNAKAVLNAGIETHI